MHGRTKIYWWWEARNSLPGVIFEFPGLGMNRTVVQNPHRGYAFV